MRSDRHATVRLTPCQMNSGPTETPLPPQRAGAKPAGDAPPDRRRDRGAPSGGRASADDGHGDRAAGRRSAPTVYNNFPEDRELFAACQAHFLTEHPPPDLSDALMLGDPAQRLRAVLIAFYAWYRETEAMAGNVQRDDHLLPELDALLEETGDRALARLADEFRPRLPTTRARRRPGAGRDRPRARLPDLATAHRRRPDRCRGGGSNGRGDGRPGSGPWPEVIRRHRARRSATRPRETPGSSSPPPRRPH